MLAILVFFVLYLYFVFVFLSSSSFCIWPAAINPMFAKANRSVCYPDWIFARPNWIFAQPNLMLV